jgi:hypothetical protein
VGPPCICPARAGERGPQPPHCLRRPQASANSASPSTNSPRNSCQLFSGYEIMLRCEAHRAETLESCEPRRGRSRLAITVRKRAPSARIVRVPRAYRRPKHTDRRRRCARSGSTTSSRAPTAPRPVRTAAPCSGRRAQLPCSAAAAGRSDPWPMHWRHVSSFEDRRSRDPLRREIAREFPGCDPPWTSGPRVQGVDGRRVSAIGP